MKGRSWFAARTSPDYSPRAAIVKASGWLHQHFRLVGRLHSRADIALGFEPRGRYRMLDAAASRESAARCRTSSGLALDPDAVVNDLPVGLQQRVEIVKTLMREAHVLIFDEPTAVTHRGGVRRPLHDPAQAARGRAGDHLHHPQAARGARACRHDLRPAEGKLVATLKPGETSVAELGNADGGARGRHCWPGDRAPGDCASGERGREPLPRPHGRRRRCSPCGTAALRPKTLQLGPGAATSPSRRTRGRSGFCPRRRRQRPAGDHLPPHGHRAPDEGTVTGQRQGPHRGTAGAYLARGSASSPPTAARGLVLPMSIARTCCLTAGHERRFFRARGLLLNERRSTPTPGVMEKYDIRAQRPEQLVATCPAATSRSSARPRAGTRHQRARRGASHARPRCRVHRVRSREVLELEGAGPRVVVVTSDLDEATALSDVICVLYGRHRPASSGRRSPARVGI